MFIQSQTSSRPKRRTPNKIITGFAGLAAAAIVSAGGFAMAAPANKPTKAECAQAGYTNYGQCVKDWAHQHGQGGGYGGSGDINTINANVNVDASNSHDNIINVIINFFR
ncbi:MAG TPA: hypothetical protein VLF43_04490 [Candidatus Saccharimonadales bacterium]|nr:hypothetical protein [Candidatus Saccharimonadales bacterium]